MVYVSCMIVCVGLIVKVGLMKSVKNLKIVKCFADLSFYVAAPISDYIHNHLFQTFFSHVCSCLRQENRFRNQLRINQNGHAGENIPMTPIAQV